MRSCFFHRIKNGRLANKNSGWRVKSAILRDLRARTARPIQPMHMAYRPRPDSPTLSTEEKNQLTRLLADPIMSDCRVPLEAMREAGTKGDYEQESLGPPELVGWPFYAFRV